jgi:hypothetical protein
MVGAKIFLVISKTFMRSTGNHGTLISELLTEREYQVTQLLILRPNSYLLRFKYKWNSVKGITTCSLNGLL